MLSIQFWCFKLEIASRLTRTLLYSSNKDDSFPVPGTRLKLTPIYIYIYI